MAKKLKIKMVRSRIGRSDKQKKVLDGLGLRKMHHEIVRQDTPAIRGMIHQVAFMLHVEEC